MKRQALTDRLLVLGVDGLEPRRAKRMMAEGHMPNLKKIYEAGCQREDMVMLGSNPTVTPPQWTTLACGCHPYEHTITQFFRHDPNDFANGLYNLDSRNCQAEQIWNCTAEAGYKTCVFHWPGSSWPPTSDSENLYVIDGTTPGAVGMGVLQVDAEIFFGASEEETVATFVPFAVTDIAQPCIIKGLDLGEEEASERIQGMGPMVGQGGNVSILMSKKDGYAIDLGGIPLPNDAAKSPIKPAKGWVQAPADAKEFSMITYGGLVRRPCLILKNEQGIYDRIEMYKSKKDTVPLATMEVNKMVYCVVDDGFKGDKKTLASRNYKLLELAEDGSNVRIFISCAYEMDNDSCFHPKYLHKALLENAGPFPSVSQLWHPSHDMFFSMLDNWEEVARWYGRAMHYMIEKEGIEVVFSHFHNIDIVEHTFIRYLGDHNRGLYAPEVYDGWLTELYKQTDRYLGQFVHYLDEGWTVIVTSDHGQVGPEHEPATLGDMCGTVIVPEMRELGYTVMIKDENGEDTKEVDWTKTTATAFQGNDIFINLKGRNGGRGIVDPADQYELEEKIMTDLLGLKDPVTGKRMISVALRKRDAVAFGYGGPTAGDIFYATAEGYQFDHCDGLSTSYGEFETSLSPIFVAAGPGIKKGEFVNRVIRQIDFAPTVSMLLGCRFPANCEGAPVYQILSEEV